MHQQQQGGHARSTMGPVRFALVLAAPAAVSALDNGLGLTPQMGYSSWNDCGSVVTEEHIKATATYMISSGLAAKGFNFVQHPTLSAPF